MFFYPEIRDETQDLANDFGSRCPQKTVLSDTAFRIWHCIGILNINTFVCNQQDFWLFDDFCL